MKNAERPGIDTGFLDWGKSCSRRAEKNGCYGDDRKTRLVQGGLLRRYSLYILEGFLIENNDATAF